MSSESSSTDCAAKRLIKCEESLQTVDDEEFSLLSYNILSDKYYKKGFKDDPVDAPAKIDWQVRRDALLNIMLKSGADVICLQEIEIPSFAEDFGNQLESAGYSFVEQKIKNSKSKAKPHTTGIVTAFRSSKFACEWEKHQSRTLAVGLRRLAKTKTDGDPELKQDSTSNGDISDRGDPSLLYIGNCHLEGHPTLENKRFSQVRSLFQKVQGHITQEIQSSRSKSAKKAAESTSSAVSSESSSNLPLSESQCRLIVCGDFNCEERGRVCEFLHKGELKAGCTDYMDPEVPVTTKDQAHPFSFRHAYQDLEESYPTFSPHPALFRARTIDFIWYNSPSLANVATREVVPKDKFESIKSSGTGIPNDDHPSDHFPVGAVFQFRKESAGGSSVN